MVQKSTLKMRQKLLRLLNNGDFISGEILAKKLNVSRTAVWKQINNLGKIGYKFESVKNKGYRLVSKPDKPIPEEITPYLDTRIIGREFHYFEKVGSTNTKAKELIKKDAAEGTVVVSDIQTHGRGRKNRTWISKEGGLWFSIVLYPDIQPEFGMVLTMASSVAVVESLETVAGIDTVIKWPNDVLINKKKVCGILTEFDAEIDKINYAIIGIGINVNNDIDDSLKNSATSIKKEIGRGVSKINLLRSIINNFDKYYLYIKDGKYDKIQSEWLPHSNIIGKKIIVKQNTKTTKGIVKNIDKNGSLILNTDRGKIRILSGDVQYL